MTRQQTIVGTPLAVVQKSLVAQLYLIYIADADDAFAFVHAVNRKLQRYGLHKSVLATLLDVGTRKIRNHCIARCIDNDLCHKGEMPLVGGENQTAHGIALLYHVVNGALQIYVYILVRHELRQDEFRSLEIVSLARNAYHVVVGYAEQSHQFVAHGSFADHAEYRSHITDRQVAAYHAVTFDKRNLRTVACCCYRCTNSGRSCTCHDDIIAGAYPDIAAVSNGLHCQNVFTTIQR